MNVTSGLFSETPLVLYDLDSHCWKMSQGTFLWDSGVFLGTWPSSGTTRNGIAYPRRPSVPRISVTGCSSWPTPVNKPGGGMGLDGGSGAREMLRRQGWWPTPTVTDMGSRKTPDEWDEWTAEMKTRHGNGNGHGRSLAIEAQRFPTPTTQDASNNAGPSQSSRNTPPPNAVAGGALNPTWVEWLMGFPLGWTDLEPSATP